MDSQRNRHDAPIIGGDARDEPRPEPQARHLGRPALGCSQPTDFEIEFESEHLEDGGEA